VQVGTEKIFRIYLEIVGGKRNKSPNTSCIFIVEAIKILFTVFTASVDGVNDLQ
jgi:hypothetical protein